LTGSGFKELLEMTTLARDEYINDYKPEYERIKAKREKEQKKKQQEQLERFQKDLQMDEALSNDNKLKSHNKSNDLSQQFERIEKRFPHISLFHKNDDNDDSDEDRDAFNVEENDSK
jgi:transposase